MNPLVSVIIPVYNVMPYLREAMDSVIGQAYENIEIVIIDDGSTDGSEKICEEYSSDSRVTIIHQVNRGLSNARNVGLSLVNGAYLCFLDPDDAYHPAFIEKLLDAIQRTGAEMAACRYSSQKTNGNLGASSNRAKLIRPSLKLGTYSNEDALRSLAIDEFNVSVWNKIYKRNLWNNIRFPDGHNYEDAYATYPIVEACQKISMIDEILYYHRDRGESISHNYSLENTRDWMLARSHIETFVLSHHPRIFSDVQVDCYKQRNLKEYMWLFANYHGDKAILNDIRVNVIEKGKGIKQWNIRTKMAYWMVCYTPPLFRGLYLILMHFRVLVWKVTGR